MSVKIGSYTVKSIYVGEQKIVKAYVGEDLVFSEKKASRLPAGYTELEYVEARKAQGIQTNIAPNANTQIECDISIYGRDSDSYASRILSTSITDNFQLYAFFISFSAYGSSSATGKDSFGGNMGKNNGVAVKPSGSYTINRKYHVKFDTKAKTMTIDSNIATFSDNTVHANQPSWRLFCATVPKSEGSGNAFNGRIYGLSLVSNGVKLLDLVPCKNAGNIAGFYNMADNTFIRSSSPTDFLPGPAV